MIRFDECLCRNLESASTREWLEINRLGGFASSTITGMNTRCYHGCSSPATRPPLGRMVLLSKMGETLVINGRSYEPSVNRYPGVIHPNGHVYLKDFRIDPFPVFTYEIDGLQIERSIFIGL
jgi:predicted glycogen debranching enzyme